jgi:FAD/FMN-containing dehydrogenase
VRVTSWGRLQSSEHRVIKLSDRSQVSAVIQRERPGLAYGMGRSYGDVCLNPNGSLWNTVALDRFIAFDREAGIINCEPGILLRDIQRLVLPLGWMLPVTPGTQMITVGGAIANDVHGKNHHIFGTFGDNVRRIRIARTDGTTIECGPQLRVDWFSATVGGLGLTGVIVEAEIQLRRVDGPWLDTETLPYTDLGKFFRLSDESEKDWEHVVSWIDCVSGEGARGIFMRGNPSARTGTTIPRARTRTMPFVPPVSLVNRFSLVPFNSLYFSLKSRNAGRRVEHYEPFFYPLDNIHEWNRMYGPRGFYQYQCVVPRELGKEALTEMLARIAAHREGSFLAVLKTFGNRKSIGMLSFARPGVTLALDFPNRGEHTVRLFEELDGIVRATGGAIYPAKDARMPRGLFEVGYPRHREFQAYRDPGISSAMSRRLMGS